MSPGKITYERSAITEQGSEKNGSEANLTEKIFFKKLGKEELYLFFALATILSAVKTQFSVLPDLQKKKPSLTQLNLS